MFSVFFTKHHHPLLLGKTISMYALKALTLALSALLLSGCDEAKRLHYDQERKKQNVRDAVLIEIDMSQKEVINILGASVSVETLKDGKILHYCNDDFSFDEGAVIGLHSNKVFAVKSYTIEQKGACNIFIRGVDLKKSLAAKEIIFY